MYSNISYVERLARKSDPIWREDTLWFRQTLVEFGGVVSEENILFWKVYDGGQVMTKAYMTPLGHAS